MPLSAPEARTRINERVTVEMQVRAAKNCQRCSLMFLDSEANHHDPKNFAVAVSDAGKRKFKEAQIADPAGHFILAADRSCTRRLRSTHRTLLAENAGRQGVSVPTCFLDILPQVGSRPELANLLLGPYIIFMFLKLGTRGR